MSKECDAYQHDKGEVKYALRLPDTGVKIEQFIPHFETNPRPSLWEKNKAVKKAAMIDALVLSHGIVFDACMMVGISRQCHYQYYKDDDYYRELVDGIKEVALDFVEGKLMENIEKGYEASIIFYLKCIGKRRGYVEAKEIKKDITLRFNELTDEELEQKIRQISERIALTDGTAKAAM